MVTEDQFQPDVPKPQLVLYLCRPGRRAVLLSSVRQDRHRYGTQARGSGVSGQRRPRVRQPKAVREYNTANYPLYPLLARVGNCGGKGILWPRSHPAQLGPYKTAGTAMGVDLLNGPDLVVELIPPSFGAPAWYWMTGTSATGNAAKP